MIKIVRNKDIPYIPASHEDPNNPGVLKKILFTYRDIFNGRLQMINWALLPAGKSFTPHYHENMQEIFILIKGKAKMKVGRKSFLVNAGDAVSVPAKLIHTMKNLSKKDTHYLVIGITQGKGGKTIVV